MPHQRCAKADTSPLTLRQREVYQEILRARASDSMTTLAQRLGVSRQRVHEVIRLIKAAGVPLPPWAAPRARSLRRTRGWTRRKKPASGW